MKREGEEENNLAIVVFKKVTEVYKHALSSLRTKVTRKKKREKQR